jgi:hypothetical protein
MPHHEKGVQEGTGVDLTKKEVAAAAWLQRGGALVTGRRNGQVHELHHIGELQWDLCVEEEGWWGTLSMVATTVRKQGTDGDILTDGRR